MMKNLNIQAFLLIAISFLSCKKVITVQLNNSPTQLVITGEVTDASGPYTVSINSSINFSQPNTFPPVSGAQVIISDNQRLKDTLTETSPGNYNTHSYWQGVPGNTYTLSVLSSGKSFTAVSTMPLLVPLDSVTFQKSGRDNGKAAIEAVANFQDPPGVANYYQFTEKINDTMLTKIFIFQDRLSDGKYTTQSFDNDSSALKIGDQLTFSMYSIDENIFKYFFELKQLLNANPFNEATPANPDTNLTNGALGYFSAHTIQTRSLTVHF
jgi:Domain of unknown function (DUF4249)